jgi:hypothetical protein
MGGRLLHLNIGGYLGHVEGLRNRKSFKELQRAVQ